MTKNKQTNRPASHALLRCSLLVLVYVVFILTLAPNGASMHLYHLSPTSYRIIMLVIAIPSILVWFTAFVGYDALQKYAYAIRKTPEGAYYQQLATGCSWLIWSLPIPIMLSLLLNAIGNKHPGFHPTAIIFTNYINLLLPLIAFMLMSRGGQIIMKRPELHKPRLSAQLLTMLFIACGVMYCWLATKHLDMQNLSNSHNPYFLPTWLVIISVIIPYLYAWFAGLTTTYQIAVYSKNTAGLLYRRALVYFVVGFGAVIFSSVALQYVNIVVPRVGHLLIDYRFALTMLFRIIGAAGFIALAIGANRLKKIEEV